MKQTFRKIIRHLTRWAWHQEATAFDGMAELRSLVIKPGAMEAEIKADPDLQQYVVQCFAEMVAKSPNYTECNFEFKDRTKWERITVTIQKGSGKTPHVLRMEAEAKCRQLEQQIEQLKNQPTDHNAEPRNMV